MHLIELTLSHVAHICLFFLPVLTVLSPLRLIVTVAINACHHAGLVHVSGLARPLDPSKETLGRVYNTSLVLPAPVFGWPSRIGFSGSGRHPCPPCRPSDAPRTDPSPFSVSLSPSFHFLAVVTVTCTLFFQNRS